MITDADGTEVATYAIEKDFASVVYSSADIEQGATYTVTVDGTATTVTAGEAPAGRWLAARWAADPIDHPSSPSTHHEGTDMTENQLPTAPATDTAHAPYAESPAPTRTWRDRLPSGRKAITAGAVVAGLAVGGAGFGAGYAVGHDDSRPTSTTTQTTDGSGDRPAGFPGDGRGPMGDLDGDGGRWAARSGRHHPGRRRHDRARRPTSTATASPTPTADRDRRLDARLRLAEQLTPRTDPPRAPPPP